MVRAAGKGPGGDCWLLLQSARIEAKELKHDIEDVVIQLQGADPADHHYVEALQFQHRKLWEACMMKQIQIGSLNDCISVIVQQQVSLYPDPCPRSVPESLLAVSQADL